MKSGINIGMDTEGVPENCDLNRKTNRGVPENI